MEQPTHHQDQPAQRNDRWYRRMGRGARRCAKRALLPAALTITLGAAAYGGFCAGRHYQEYGLPGFGLEETIMEQKIERRLFRKDGNFYLQENIQNYKMIIPSDSQDGLKGRIVKAENI